MKNNLSLLLALIGGIFVGMSGIAPDWMHDESLPMMVLCVLILQVGIGRRNGQPHGDVSFY